MAKDKSSGEPKPNTDAPQATGADKGGALKSLVQVESIVQLALVLPVATVVGLLAGMGLDKWLHQHWIYLPGLLLGAAAGFVQIFRVVFALNKN